MPLEFITSRELGDASGNVKGKIRIMKMREEPDAMVEYTCPACGFSEKKKLAWGEPLVSGTGKGKKFAVTCGKCTFSMKFQNLKKEADKEMKARKKSQA